MIENNSFSRRLLKNRWLWSMSLDVVRALMKDAVLLGQSLSKSLIIKRENSSYFWRFLLLRHLAKETKCFTLFATHFHEITDLANTVDTVKNSHMAAISNKETFTLLYQVRPGVMDKSFGIHIAKLANFPEDVVKVWAHSCFYLEVVF